MDPTHEVSDAALPSLPEVVTRTLRHEVGDLLQSIYSTVALLQHRLPESAQAERRLVTNLRSRAEACKCLLDSVHDFVCPVTLSHAPVDLAELAVRLVALASVRFPHLEIRLVSGDGGQIEADAQRLTNAGNLLLSNACSRARRHVQMATAAGPAPGEVQWTTTDDGPAMSPEQIDLLLNSFALSNQGHLTLGLAPARKIVLIHGGRLLIDNLAEGGRRLTVVLPTEPQHAEIPHG
jgi:K+-sensing histidine kinase KdpD